MRGRLVIRRNFVKVCACPLIGGPVCIGKMEKHGVQILGKMKPEYNSVLTSETVAFAGHIQRKFGFRVLDLLQKRNERQAK